MSTQTSTANAWWTTLRHGGVLISPLVLDETLPQGPATTSDWEVDKLRRAWMQFTQRPEGAAAAQKHLEQAVGPWLDAVLETFLGHTAPNWQKGPLVGDRFKHTEPGGSIRKPNRVLTNATKEHEPSFLVLIDKDRMLKDDGTPGQIGIHGGRRTYGQLLGLMRATNVKLGILTNGFQFRLVYAGLDHDAWIEWNAEAWFEGGDGRRALDGLRALLGVERIPPSSDSSTHPLLEVVEESRRRQADLSHVMGTQVREAVELLLNALDDHLAIVTPEEREGILAPLRRLGLQRQAELDALYQAAIRVVMRLVVTAYAESRELFPVSQPAYHQSYSLDALFRELQHAKIEEGLDALRHQEGAWARLVSHSRLVHAGSRHPSLQMVAYGGRLFEPPGAEPSDPVMAGLAVLESPHVRVNDATVQRVLELLKIGKFKAARGKWLTGPVDFSDLRTEYIGMMYEGLLDYQLREAREEDGGIVVVNLGEQPALPLRVLTSLSDDRLKKLIAELKKKTKGKSAADEGDDASDDEAEDEAADDGETDENEASEDDADSESSDDGDDSDSPKDDASPQERFEAEVQAWAERAVRLNPTIFLSAKERKLKDTTEKKKAEQRAARRLVLKSIRPGGTYLVRWSGTRKGSGTFYTKPALAVPTVNRTLEPLAYTVHDDGTRTPKTPDQILGLKVCDPAMGSGSFLVAALRYLTQALSESFEHHVNRHVAAGQPLASPLGENSKALYGEVLLPLYQSAAQGDGPDPAPLIEARLKRSVVERCIYGVDLNPLAVELGKLSLWIETMDPKLTFAFLDHKIKCGNSLIGAWQVQADHYPLGAWERELGDGKNNPRTKRLKRLRKDVIVPQMVEFLDQYDFVREAGKGPRRKPLRAQPQILPGQKTLGFEEAHQPAVKARPEPEVKRRTHISLASPAWDASPDQVARYTRSVYEQLHNNFDPTEQERDYRTLLANEGYQRQKFLLDLWCAAWFWPIRAPETAPLDEEPILTPKAYYAEREKPGSLSAEARAIVQHLAEKDMRFFHWEIEYPEVFSSDEGRFGFDAVVGNPPWETAKPQDNEFFTQYDPAYRTYGKQDGLKRQKELFAANTAIQEDFWNYQEGYKSQSNFIRNTHALDNPRLGGAGTNDKWLGLTRDARNLNSGTQTPYAHQGSGDLNLYKLFMERMLAATTMSGRIGVVLPTGLHSDLGTLQLRKTLFETTSWEWAFGFENKKRIFPLFGHLKFACYIFQKGGTTEEMKLAVLVRDVEEWSKPQPAAARMRRKTIEALSPSALSIVEVPTDQDLGLIERIYARSESVAAAGIEYRSEFHTTNDSGALKSAQKVFAAEGGVLQDPPCIASDGITYYPYYNGAMVGHLNPNYNGWIGKWDRLPIDAPNMRPKFVVSEADVISKNVKRRPKVAYRTVGRSTINPRAMIAAIVPGFPCSDKASTLCPADDSKVTLEELAAVLNSYAFDFVLRLRLSGTTLNWFIIAEMPIPTDRHAEYDRLVDIIRRLNGNHPLLNRQGEWTVDEAERAALFEEMDEIVATWYGLSFDDMRWLLHPDNADPRDLWRDYCERLKVLEAAGKRGRWYTLEEAREIRRKAGMKVDF